MPPSKRVILWNDSLTLTHCSRHERPLDTGIQEAQKLSEAIILGRWGLRNHIRGQCVFQDRFPPFANLVVRAPFRSTLTTSSNVFKNMIESGSGQRKISLEQNGIVIEQLFYIMDDAHPQMGRLSHHAEGVKYAIEVARFLHCYDCPLALRLYLDHVCDTNHPFNTVPALIPFMIGAILGRPELCMKGLSGGNHKWYSYAAPTGWIPPGDLDPQAMDKHMLDYRAIPRSFFSQIPYEYLMALLQVGILKGSPVGSENYGGRFLSYFK